MTAHRRKVCTGCLGDPKPIAAFYRHPSGKDGRASKCKVCTRAMVNANRELKAEYYRQKSQEREQDPQRLAYKRAYHRQYVKTARGRESRRITQRIYRAHRRAMGLKPFPSNHPDAVEKRRQRSIMRKANEHPQRNPVPDPVIQEDHRSVRANRHAAADAGRQGSSHGKLDIRVPAALFERPELQRTLGVEITLAIIEPPTPQA